MGNQKKSEDPSWQQVAAMFCLRIVDSGLAPWVTIALFILGLVFVGTRNLDSKDTLLMLQGIGTMKGLAWAGWVVAFVEIAICKAVVSRARIRGKERVTELQTENEKARELLKKHRQTELKLEQ